MDVPHNGPPNKHILHSRLQSDASTRGRYKVGVFVLFQDCDVVEFDVEKLVDGFEDSFYCEIILEFDGDLLVYQRLEERVEHYALAASVNPSVRICKSFGEHRSPLADQRREILMRLNLSHQRT
jgi:hypothetical protein